MRTRRLSIRTAVILVGLSLTLLGTAIAFGQEKVLYSFHYKGGPASGLIRDASGDLYGTTIGGGYDGSGFCLVPSEDGGWREYVWHFFGAYMDGQTPMASVIPDGSGNLYGTTEGGGVYGSGTVFVSAPMHGTEKVLHNFGTAMDGQDPKASLIFDAAGNLYGTTYAGGTHGAGTVFELTPNGSGGWTERVLHSFGDGMDGKGPVASMVWDAAGNLYGTTSQGGVYGYGAVFEMTPRQDGGWTEKVLHNFGSGEDGRSPLAGLVWDAAGNLYGTTNAGGVYGVGTVFEMMPRQDGGWTEHTLHHFGLYQADGHNPMASLAWDAAGSLYGTAYAGGVYGFGTVFELTPDGNGDWTEKSLHHFGLYRSDGRNPRGTLIFDSAGNLYGTTYAGGVYRMGTVFEVTP